MVEEKRDNFNTKRGFVGGDSVEETSTASTSVEPTLKKPKLQDDTDSNSVKTEESCDVSERKPAESETEHRKTQKSETSKPQNNADNVKSETEEADKMKSKTSAADTSELKSEVTDEMEKKHPVTDATNVNDMNSECNVDYSMYQPGIMNLCDDVLLNIMRHCSARDRKALAFSCRRLNELSRDRMLWGRMDLRSDPVGRKQLTWFLNEFADKHTKAVMIQGHADASRGCLGKKRMKPEVDKDTKNLRNAAMKVHSLMQDYYGPAAPTNQPAPPNPVREREREDSKKSGTIKTTEKGVQTEKSGPNDEEITEEQNIGKMVAGCAKDGPTPKKQKMEENSIAGTSGVGGNSIRNVGEIEIIKTPKNGASSKNATMEVDDQKAGPSRVQCPSEQKPGPSGIEIKNDQKPGPSGCKAEGTENTGKVEIVRTPKKGCAKKIEIIRREFEKMHREIRRAGIDYSGLDKICACLNEKACQTGSDEDSYAWSTGCQSKAEDDSDSCSSSSSSNDTDSNSLSMDEGDSDNDRNRDEIPPMIPEHNFFSRCFGITPPNIARPDVMEAGEPEPIVMQGGNDDMPERERNQRLAALDLSGQNLGGNDENDSRNGRRPDNAEHNGQNVAPNARNAAGNDRNGLVDAQIAPDNDDPAHLGNIINDVADIVNMAQTASNIAENIRNMADRAANVDRDAFGMALNGDENVEGNGENENANGVHNVPVDNVPENFRNAPNDVQNIVNMAQNAANIVANIQMDIDAVRMAFNGDDNDLNVEGNGENGPPNVDNGNVNIDEEQPMEVAVEFAINAAQIADHAANFADHAADIADNAVNFVENAVDNMEQEAVIGEEEVALDLALDAAAIAERAADFAVQAADIADNAAIIAENAVDNDAEENAEANDAEMLNVALGIAMDAAENAMENEVFNRNDAQNANDGGNPAQQNVIYMAFEGFGRGNENNNAENAPLNMVNNAAPIDHENEANVAENNRNNPDVPQMNDANPVGNAGLPNENAAWNEGDAVLNNYIEDNHNRLNNRFGPIGNRHGWQPFRGFRLRRHPAEQNRQRERQYYVRGAEYFRPGMEYCDNYWPTPFENEKAEQRMKKKEAERESKCRKSSRSTKKVKRSKKKYHCSGPKWTINTEILRKLAETCPNLSELSLENCNMNTHMVKLSDFPRQLKILSLKGCCCYNTIVNKSFLFKVQDHLPDLEEMDISDCSWIDAASLLPLSKLTKLKVLKACNCVKMTECVAYASLAARFGFRALEVLDLRGSPMGDSEVSAFGWLPNLREMYLAPPLAPTLPDAPPSHKHMHALYDHTTDTSDMELWEGDEDSPEISFRTAERALNSNVTRHCCLDAESECIITDEDQVLLDPLRNNQHCSPEICNHTHRYTQEDRERLAAREGENVELEGGNRSRNARDRDLERVIRRRVGELLRRNRPEGERDGAGPVQVQEGLQVHGQENRVPLPGDRAPIQERNAEGEEDHPRPRRNVEEVMRAWANLAQEWHSRERNRNQARRLNMRPVVQFIQPGDDERRQEVRVDAGGRFHIIYVNARRPRQDLAHGQVRAEGPNNARPPNEQVPREGYVNIRREYINGPANIRPPVHNVHEPARQMQQGQGDGQENRALSREPGRRNHGNCDRNCAAENQGPANQDPLGNNPDLVERDLRPEHNLPQGNLIPVEQPNRCRCHNRHAEDDPNPANANRNRGFPGVPWMHNILPEALPQLDEDFPYAVNPPPPFHRFVQRNIGGDPRNRAPGQANHAVQPPRPADRAPRPADQSLRQIDLAPALADQAPRRANQGLGQADQSPRQANQGPRQADQGPRIADHGPRIADHGPRIADQAPRIADQAPRQADQAPRIADQAPIIGDQAPRRGDQNPGERLQGNQGLEQNIGPEHVFRFQGPQIFPVGIQPRLEAVMNARRDILNGPAHFRIPNQENERDGIHMNIHVHREVYVNGHLVRDQRDGENRAANNDQPQQRPVVGMMPLPLVQNIFYGPIGGHIEGSSLISDSSLLRFGLSAGNRNNFVHIGANGALQAVFPHANWTDKPDKARLEILVVRGYTGVTNRTLRHFATAAPQLREIDLTDTNVTLQGVESFSAIRPDVKVICDHLKEKRTEPTKKE